MQLEMIITSLSAKRAAFLWNQNIFIQKWDVETVVRVRPMVARVTAIAVREVATG